MNKMFLRTLGGIMASVILANSVYLSEAVIPMGENAKVRAAVSTETSANKSTQTEKSKETLPTEEVTLYVDKDKYFALETDEAIKWISSDENILTIDDSGLAHPLKEGEVTITAACNSYIKTFNVTVTTYNNGKDVIHETTTNEQGWLPNNGGTTLWIDANIEMVKNNINTLTDMTAYILERWMYYDPSFHIVATETKWTWAMDASAVIEAGKGVCCDIANVAHYVLKDDFERAGFVYETGRWGHIYNWFYEDGWYYVHDYTNEISDRAFSCDAMFTRDNRTYYQNQTKKFKTWDEFMAMRLEDPSYKKDYDQNILAVYVIDATEFDECPPVYLDYMKNSIDGWVEMGNTPTVGFEEGVDVKEIYRTGTWKFECRIFKSEELPEDVPSINEDYNRQRWMFQY